MAKTIKSTAIVAYPVHAVLLNAFTTERQWFTGNKHTVLLFLAVCCTDGQVEKEGDVENEELLVYRCTSLMAMPLESDVRVAADSVGRERWITVYHKALKIVVESLRKRELNGVFIKDPSAKRVEVLIATCLVLF